MFLIFNEIFIYLYRIHVNSQNLQRGLPNAYPILNDNRAEPPLAVPPDSLGIDNCKWRITP